MTLLMLLGLRKACLLAATSCYKSCCHWRWQSCQHQAWPCLTLQHRYCSRPYLFKYWEHNNRHSLIAADLRPCDCDVPKYLHLRASSIYFHSLLQRAGGEALDRLTSCGSRPRALQHLYLPTNIHQQMFFLIQRSDQHCTCRERWFR